MCKLFAKNPPGFHGTLGINIEGYTSDLVSFTNEPAHEIMVFIT